MIKYDDIIIRDNMKEIESGISERSAASVDIIPFGQDVMTWEVAEQKYDKVLYRPEDSVVSERTCNCYVRGKNLSQKATRGIVQLFLMPFNAFCNPKRWCRLNAYSSDKKKFITEVPMISKKSGVLSNSIGAGDVCINQSAFILSDDYHLKKGTHYCLCAVVNTPNHPIIIPENFTSNIEVDRWVTKNPNVALLNVYPVEMQYKQLEYSFEFGNLNDKPGDFQMTIIFTCDYEKNERWSTESPVRVQCTDSAYPFDYKDLRIQTYQPSIGYQSIVIRLNEVPAGFDGQCMVYIENKMPAPEHGIVKMEYDECLREIPKGYEQEKERLLPDVSYTGKVGYLLHLGECFVYNSKINIHQFYEIRDELAENLKRDRKQIWSDNING